MRNLDIEFKDNELRKYQYSFDGVIRMKLLERWLPRLQQNQPSLEMGSFDGSMTELLAEQLSDLEVVEGSGELAQVVREKLPNLARVNHSMFEEFSPARLFQQIFLVHGLEHLENPVEVLPTLETCAWRCHDAHHWLVTIQIFEQSIDIRIL